MTKIVVTLSSKINRKLSITFQAEHEVSNDVEAREKGEKTANLFLAYSEGFANAEPRRY